MNRIPPMIRLTSARSVSGMALRVALVLLAFLPYISFANTASLHETWQKGNALYQRKAYDSAAFYFEQIAATKPADATIYYNLGNTYYRLNKVGLSVLNYERALRRSPHYKEAGDNLLLAKSRIAGGYRQPPEDIFFVGWWRHLTAPGLMMEWAVLSLVFFISLIGLLLYRRLKRGRVFIRPQWLGGLTLLWLLSLLLAFSSAYAVVRNVKGVVVSGAVQMRRQDSKGTTMLSLPEGTTVNVRSKVGDTYEVALEDGTDGMMSSSDLVLVD